MAESTVDDVPPTAGSESLQMQDTPPTPPSPEDFEGLDTKASRKREREVSLEPATPRADEPISDEHKERRTPAKKNRVKLGPTAEEDESPPTSPDKAPLELSTSPRHESKVRQISMKVRDIGLKWDSKTSSEHSQGTPSPFHADEASSGNPDIELQPAAELLDVEPFPQPTQLSAIEDPSQTNIDMTDSQPDESISKPLTRTATMESDSDDQERLLKRKLVDRVPSSSGPGEVPQTSMEPVKRARDDTEEDENPREKKRPTPPPEERKAENVARAEPSVEAPSETVDPQPKVGGFLAYASSSSPFATTKGRPVFGTKSAPSPSLLAGPSNGNSSSFSSSFENKPSSSPFSLSDASKSNPTPIPAFASTSATSPESLSVSPTGTKRSGFEAFASSSSPFASAAARTKSPTGFLRGNASSGFGLARSKSPPRRGAGSSVNAFKSYVGSGSQSFSTASPPIKKPRQDSGEESEAAEGEKSKASNVNALSGGALSNGASPEGSEEENEKPASFGDRLRAGKNDDETSRASSEEEDKVAVTEQEVTTGEENDDTIFTVRGKLYALSDQNAWKERGTGLLKLNVRKLDGGGARLLMRKEAVYTLLLNVTLFKGMRCSLAQDPRYVRFSCFESGATAHYNIRLANAKVAGELLEEINANIPSDEHDNAI